MMMMATKTTAQLHAEFIAARRKTVPRMINRDTIKMAKRIGGMVATMDTKMAAVTQSSLIGGEKPMSLVVNAEDRNLIYWAHPLKKKQHIEKE